MQNGALLERELISLQMLPFGGTYMLVYSYDTGGRGFGMVPHDSSAKDRAELELLLLESQNRRNT
jgi:hypothetical protein